MSAGGFLPTTRPLFQVDSAAAFTGKFLLAYCSNNTRKHCHSSHPVETEGVAPSQLVHSTSSTSRSQCRRAARSGKGKFEGAIASRFRNIFPAPLNRSFGATAFKRAARRAMSAACCLLVIGGPSPQLSLLTKLTPTSVGIIKHAL